jgi:signal transduction histidine kinase
MRSLERALTAGVVALGAALLAVAVPRAVPAETGTFLGFVLVAVALGAALVPGGSLRSAGAALAAGAAAVVVAGGHAATATVVERDLGNGALALVLPLVSAAMIRSAGLAALAAVGGILAGPVRVLVYDPFLDPGCLSCTPGRLVVWPAPDLAAALQLVGLLVGVLAVLAALTAQRSPVELVAVLAGLTGYALGGPHYPIALIGVVVATIWLARTTAAAWHRRRAVRRLLSALEDGDDLSSVLRRALGDPGLVVTFPDGDLFVDRTGLATAPSPGQATTDLRVEKTLVARILHSPRTRVPEVANGLDGAARLALGNERLTAQLAARVDELTRSRAAVVEHGVRDRRALERDLHDGVQQDLLALGLDLRVAASRLDKGNPDRALLEDAVNGVRDALDAVRDISHGAYPPLLATRGLAAATRSLARRTSAAVDVDQLPDDRLPDAVERAVFAVVAEALERGADRVSATIANGRVVVLAEGARPGVDGILPDLVAAVGGELDLGRRISAVIPCA